MITNESSHSSGNEVFRKTLRVHGMKIIFVVFSLLWLTLVAATWTMP